MASPRRFDRLRVAQASLQGATRRLEDLDSVGTSGRRFTDAEREQARSEAMETIARALEQIRQLGGDPDAAQRGT